MAHGESLQLREIQPHFRNSAHKENGWRRHSKQGAKRYGISRRRFLRKVNQERRNMRTRGEL